MSRDLDIEDASAETDSQILKLGQKAIQKSATGQFVVGKGSTRGSFLSRSEIILAKLAERTRVGKSPVLGAPKVTTKFTFQTIDSNIFKEVSQFAYHNLQGF